MWKRLVVLALVSLGVPMVVQRSAAADPVEPVCITILATPEVKICTPPL